MEPRRLVRSASALPPLRGEPLVVVAAGKAAWPMADAVAHDGGYLVRAGLIAGPRPGDDRVPDRFEWIEGSHPRPNVRSEEAGRRALDLAGRSREPGTLLVLLSGGASSLVAVPAAGITLEEKAATIAALMNEGVPIADLNCVRKHLSAIKGGRLAALAAQTLTLAISDVHAPVENDPAVIGSGPTAPDATTFGDALAILRRARGLERFPPAVVEHLRRGARGEVAETPKPGDPRLASSRYEVIASRHTAEAGAADAARERKYSVQILPRATREEAREAGAAFGRAAFDRFASDPQSRACVIASGETTVHVRGDGLGGRNQEFVLGAIGELDRFARATGALAVIASAGTDGIDGPTDAAGAIADSSSAGRARHAGLDPAGALARNASYDFFAALGDLIKWGPTGTNVGDVHVALIAAREGQNL